MLQTFWILGVNFFLDHMTCSVSIQHLYFKSLTQKSHPQLQLQYCKMLVIISMREQVGGMKK
uniref:Transmembrane protein n=1 Tax=Medicago truncatula TaxID=3880 RepID=I3S763_MEDTR|nr:unknown [Medicago truncatula]